MSLRMMDFRCPACGKERLDVLMDTLDVTPQRCCGRVMRRFWSRPPVVDARAPFYDPQAGRHFSSFHEADAHAKANGNVNLSLKDRPRAKTGEEKIEENAPKRREAALKAYYRLRHGYRDHPPLETEESLARRG